MPVFLYLSRPIPNALAVLQQIIFYDYTQQDCHEHHCINFCARQDVFTFMGSDFW